MEKWRLRLYGYILVSILFSLILLFGIVNSYILQLAGDNQDDYTLLHPLDSTPPKIIKVNASPSHQEIGSYVNISCNADDNAYVDTVRINITGPDGFSLVNTTMEKAMKNVTVSLEDIDFGSSGNYRWLDVANQVYGVNYMDNYNYSQAIVSVTFNTQGKILYGMLNATNLKPNFCYQLKLVGTSGMLDNEHIGLAGRWWQEEWNGTAWTNGMNLNNKGNGSSPNPNDLIYFSRRNITDSTSPTGLHYRFTGYLLLDYFITNGDGDVLVPFETGCSYHVLWKTTQRIPTSDDGPIKTTIFNANASSPAYDENYSEQTVSIFGEWERLPIGGVHLQSGDYIAQLMITEESFHGSGGQYAGNWATVMETTIEFNNEGQYYYNRNYTLKGEYHYSIWANDTSGNTNMSDTYNFYIYDPSIIYVDDDYNSSTVGWGVDHFDNIQDGINAVSENGTVYVYNGTYYENVVINKTINLIGEEMDNVVVDGEENDTIVINARGVHLSNLTLRESLCHGMRIEGTHNVIFKCHIVDLEGSCWSLPCGIWLLSTHNTIYDCVISDNNCSGIIISSNNNSIYSCNISHNTDGIYLGSSSNNTILGNDIKHNSNDGIFLGTSNHSVIKGNILSSNIQQGIELSYSNNNHISSNIITHNNYGLGFGYSNNNTIKCNIVCNNNYGAGIAYSNDNIFYHNNFNNSYNAYDFGSNTWDNEYPSGGNYWSNYTGIDTNGDGIGETPYDISGGLNQDRYPFVNPLIFLELSKRWNLITIPFNNTWTAETLGQNISGCTVICMFNASSQSYSTHVIGIPYNDFVIEDGAGYFVYVSYDSILTLRDVPISSVNVSIDENWNIIGWYHNDATTAASLGENITNCTVVCQFNASSQSWITHVVGIPYNDFLIERCIALFIFATEASYWPGEG
jgi:parallel beta-helix repeat protein